MVCVQVKETRREAILVGGRKFGPVLFHSGDAGLEREGGNLSPVECDVCGGAVPVDL